MKKYFIPLFFVLLGCGNHSLEDLVEELLGTGLLLEENPETIQQDIKSFSTVDASSLPKEVSLEDKYPPIQSQGRYGTCSAWSTGYALKTALNAIDNNWSPADLAKPENQTSPKDAWQIIPSSQGKSGNCNGAALSAVMNALISKGAKSMAEVPYSMEGQCEGSSNGNPNNKLANYRKIAYNYALYSNAGSTKQEGMDVNNFKSYLAQGRPVLITANVGSRFDRWNSGAVLSSDNGNGYHAMVLSGYDDSKGAKGAFRVRNSWGDKWGDNGSVWVDYDYFFASFCVEAYVAQNPNSSPDNPPDNPLNSDSYDLLTSFAEDYPDILDKTGNPRARAFSYEIYNIGTKEILASQKWSVFYMYYDAYNANEYEIIFEEFYTNERGKPCTKPEDFDNKVCWGEYEKSLWATVGATWNNMNVKPGKKAGEAEAGEGYVFEIAYEMPSITGDYYLVVYADSKDAIKEFNENNNLFYISDKNGKPLKFINGVMQQPTVANSAASAILQKRPKAAPVHSVVDLGELNAYTPQEIKTLLNRDKQSGVLAKKIAQYREKPVRAVKRVRRE